VVVVVVVVEQASLEGPGKTVIENGKDTLCRHLRHVSVGKLT
jgi:hypothetical protein